MSVKFKSAPVKKATLRVRNVEEHGGQATVIRINSLVDVGTRDGYICFWTAGREVRIGPLTAEQAEVLCEDLGYDAVV